MTSSSQKRKRDQEDSGDELEDEGELRARFQRAFEAKFKPLEKPPPLQNGQDDAEVSSPEELSDDEWSGFDEDEVTVQVVEHASTGSVELDRRAEKTFMSFRPPGFDDEHLKQCSTLKIAVKEGGDDAEDASNLKHDLALQRLLKESHLLDSNAFQTKRSEVEGRERLKALDLRLKDLGAKQSISNQQSMPLSHRKGISARKADREVSRRKEAAENGVVLEKARFVAKNLKPREKSIAGPKVGSFRSGTLKLTSKDLKSIQGAKAGKKAFGARSRRP